MRWHEYTTLNRNLVIRMQRRCRRNCCFGVPAEKNAQDYEETEQKGAQCGSHRPDRDARPIDVQAKRLAAPMW